MSYKPKVLEPTAGGTGVANTGTVTLGGNFTTSGAFTTTLTVTGNTNVTLPTSGTLATTAQIPSLPVSVANGGTGATTENQAIINLTACPASLNYGFVIIDHFTGGSPAFEMGWSANNNGGSNGSGPSVAGHYGLGLLTTAASSTGSSLFRLASSNICPGTDVMSFFFEIQVVQLSTGSETFTVDFGISDSVTAATAVTDGLYFTYTHGTNSGKWVINSMRDSSATTSNTNSTVDTNFHIFEIRTNAAWSSITFYIDGVQVGSTITTNIPTSADLMQPYLRITKSVGSTQCQLQIDTFKWVTTYTTPHSGG